MDDKVVAVDKKYTCVECQNENELGSHKPGDVVECGFCGIEYEIIECGDDGCKLTVIEEEK